MRNIKNMVPLCRLLIPVLLLSLLIGCSIQASQPTLSQTHISTAPSSSSSVPSSSATQPTTAPTQPTTLPSQPPADGNPLPEELRNNVYLDYMGEGACEAMTGKVMITIIFLSDGVSKWDADAIAAAKAQFDTDPPRLEADAASFGAELDVQINYLETSIKLSFNQDDITKMWAFSALNNLGLTAAFRNQASLEGYYGVDHAPIVFVLNREGRAFAHSSKEGNIMEYAVLYSSQTTALRHELSHLFGAIDFYFPAETLTAATKYLPNSIMDDGINGIYDPFTAFVIGWTDTLHPDAEAFLRATNHITPEYLLEALEKDQMTGYGTKQFGEDTYTGYMVNGVPHGEGTYTWADGSSYTGDWDNGKRNGEGKMIWSDGSWYEGEWKDNRRNGVGKFQSAEGYSMEGRWENNQYLGPVESQPEQESES